MTIAQDIQGLEPGALVTLYELDATSLGGTITRFHAGTNGLTGGVVWQGNTYVPLPVEADGFDFSGKGQLPRPRIKVANTGGAMGALAAAYGDLLGAKLTRRRTMAKYLDAANFPARRNQLTWTEDLRNTTEAGDPTRAWSQFNDTGNAVLVTYGTDVLGPGGRAGPVSKLQAGATGTIQRQVTQQRTTLAVDGQDITLSIYVKAAEAAHCALVTMTRDTLYPLVRLNLQTGQASSIAAGAASFSAFGAQDVGDGWWRLWGTVNVRSGTGTPYLGVQLLASNYGQLNATAVGQGIYLWGAQAEIGTTLTEYQPVTTGTWSANPTADPTAEFPPDVFYVDRKSAENKVLVEWELAAAFDVAGVMLPRRPMTQNVCTWRYRVNDASSACSYAGTSYFDANDNPVGSAGLDVCGKRLSSCKARFGVSAALPFGGFPGVGLSR